MHIVQFFFKNNARFRNIWSQKKRITPDVWCFQALIWKNFAAFPQFTWQYTEYFVVLVDWTKQIIQLWQKKVYWQPLALFTTNIAICTLDYVLPTEGSISSIKHSRSPSPVLAQAWTSLTPTALSDKPTQIASKKYSQRLIVYIPDYVLFLPIDSPKSYAQILQITDLNLTTERQYWVNMAAQESLW